MPIGVVHAYAGIFCLVSARKWFTGPRAQGDELALEAVERNLHTAEQQSTF